MGPRRARRVGHGEAGFNVEEVRRLAGVGGRRYAGVEGVGVGEGLHLDTLYFFYTTCPRCAKAHGHNYVVGVAR